MLQLYKKRKIMQGRGKSGKQALNLTEEMVYDLMVAIDQIRRGDRKEPSLFVKAQKKSKSAQVKE